MLRDIIDRKLITVEPDARIADVAKLMEREDVGAVLVLTNGEPRGIVTDRDIVVRCVSKNLDVSDTTVENILTESVATVNERDGFFDCIEKMHDAGVRRIPVVDDQGKAVGIVSFGDLVGIIAEELHELTAKTTPLEEKKVA